MNNRGQILVGVIVMMLVMAIVIPSMILYIQNEAKWSLKEGRNMTAFQLAEAGVDRGYRKISESTTTWNNCQGLAGVAQCPTYYQGDQTFSDIAGGTYKVYITSGPTKQQVTIISVGRETKQMEVRAIKAVYANTPLGNTAVRGKSGMTLGGSNMTIEWGAAISANAMVLTGLSDTTHPQFWSASSITPFKLTNAQPLCDSPHCWQWHAFQNTIPPAPDIDTTAFALTASTETGCPTYSAGTPSGSCYYNGDQDWGSANTNCNDGTTCADGKVYYINGNLNISANGIYIKGTLIVTGNLTLPNGRAGQGGPSIQVPQQAWQQYGNAWTYYRGSGWDSTAPTEFPGLDSSYLSPAVNLVAPSGTGGTPDCMTGGGKALVNGFLYVGGALTQSGGSGKTCVYGSIMVVGTVTVTPNNFNVFYTDYGGDQLKSTQVILSRISWQDLPNRGF